MLLRPIDQLTCTSSRGLRLSPGYEYPMLSADVPLRFWAKKPSIQPQAASPKNSGSRINPSGLDHATSLELDSVLAVLCLVFIEFVLKFLWFIFHSDFL